MSETREVQGELFATHEAIEEGKEAREEALRRVEENANAEWVAAAHKALVTLATNRQWVTSDMVMVVLSGEHRTHEPRALGPIFVAAAKAGTIEATGLTINSERQRRHRAPVRVWRSKLYKGAPTFAIDLVRHARSVANHEADKAKAGHLAPDDAYLRGFEAGLLFNSVDRESFF